ncbi:hypothetical protein [Alteribacter aurantiacus]|uniref:hypothetical protein n=1 Tax=Alteribacter aurantiacus TaxID=254410 RepID=UPI0003F4F03F|nr:hypothetical protein [Alteribacter aurantiacus]
MIEILTIMIVTILIAVALFQFLLALGLPFGEAAMGGYFRVLPWYLRVVSTVNGLILLLMAVVFLMYGGFISVEANLPLLWFVWGIAIFMGLNTVANAFSKSKKEKMIMTPVSAIAFILCLSVALM